MLKDGCGRWRCFSRSLTLSTERVIFLVARNSMMSQVKSPPKNLTILYLTSFYEFPLNNPPRERRDSRVVVQGRQASVRSVVCVRWAVPLSQVQKKKISSWREPD